MTKEELIKLLAEIKEEEKKDSKIELSLEEANKIKEQVQALQKENKELKELAKKGEPTKKGESDFMKELFK